MAVHSHLALFCLVSSSVRTLGHSQKRLMQSLEWDHTISQHQNARPHSLSHSCIYSRVSCWNCSQEVLHEPRVTVKSSTHNNTGTGASERAVVMVTMRGNDDGSGILSFALSTSPSTHSNRRKSSLIIQQ